MPLQNCYNFVSGKTVRMCCVHLYWAVTITLNFEMPMMSSQCDYESDIEIKKKVLPLCCQGLS